MTQHNLSVAKGKLSQLVNAALKGKDVLICKHGVPVVRLVPVQPTSAEDPCRVMPDLVVDAGDEGLQPLADEEWASLAQ
jgi:prevent-host-death family protein